MQVIFTMKYIFFSTLFIYANKQTSNIVLLCIFNSQSFFCSSESNDFINDKRIKNHQVLHFNITAPCSDGFRKKHVLFIYIQIQKVVDQLIPPRSVKNNIKYIFLLTKFVFKCKNLYFLLKHTVKDDHKHHKEYSYFLLFGAICLAKNNNRVFEVASSVF